MMYECIGVIKNILFSYKEFQIFNVITEEKNIRVKLSDGDFCEGESISVTGNSEHHQKFGLQLITTSAKRVRVTNSLLKIVYHSGYRYTAIAIAKKKVILISKSRLIDNALSRGFSFENRHSRLYID